MIFPVYYIRLLIQKKRNREKKVANANILDPTVEETTLIRITENFDSTEQDLLHDKNIKENGEHKILTDVSVHDVNLNLKQMKDESRTIV